MPTLRSLFKKSSSITPASSRETKNNPAQIWYMEGQKEILAHEMFHCEVGGPLHEGELLVAGRAVAAEWLDPYNR